LTVAEIDPGQLFYLRARGIPKDQARALLIESFAAAALEKLEDEAIREALQHIAREWLSRAPV
jgi:Fe-S cluster assembly protein SufD